MSILENCPPDIEKRYLDRSSALVHLIGKLQEGSEITLQDINFGREAMGWYKISEEQLQKTREQNNGY